MQIVIPFDDQIGKDTSLYKLYNTNLHEKIAEEKAKKKNKGKIMFEMLLKEINNKNNKYEFYKVEVEEIKAAEERMGYLFPTMLKAFYSEVGYGFIKGSPSFINRIMAPNDVADFMCEDEEYQFVDKTIYNKDDLIFFHISDEDFLTIELGGENNGAVKYFGEVIAIDLLEFVSKMMVDPNYFI